MVDIFGVIADPSRRRILELLSEKDSRNGTATVELNVSQLVELTELTQPSVSKQLKVLREGGLVSSRSEGQQRFYSIAPNSLHEVSDWVETFMPAEKAAASAVETPGTEGSGSETKKQAVTPLLPEWPESVLGLVRDAGEAFSNLQGQAVRTFDFMGDQVDKVKKTSRRLLP